MPIAHMSPRTLQGQNTPTAYKAPFWLEVNLPYGFGYDRFYRRDAHGVELYVSIHQGVRPLDLEKGSAGVMDIFVR